MGGGGWAGAVAAVGMQQQHRFSEARVGTPQKAGLTLHTCHWFFTSVTFPACSQSTNVGRPWRSALPLPALPRSLRRRLFGASLWGRSESGSTRPKRVDRYSSLVIWEKQFGAST